MRSAGGSGPSQARGSCGEPAALKALFGENLVREMLLGGTRAVPAKLQEHGFRWLHPTLEVALRDILGR